MDNTFGRQQLENFSQIRWNSGVQPIEIQARAFENYGTMREYGKTRMDVIRKGMIAMLDKEFQLPRGSWKNKLTAEAFTVLAEAWERIYTFAERTSNFIEGNGFQSILDIFEEAYTGELAAGKAFEGFYEVLEMAQSITPDQMKQINAEGKWDEVMEMFDRGEERMEYWNKWKGKRKAEANLAISSIDEQIAALKKQASEGGC